MPNKISFKTGTQTAYDEARAQGTVLDENIYVTTHATPVAENSYIEGANRLYKGDQLLGDAYVSAETPDATVSATIGGVPSGTTLSSIMRATQGSVSKLLDMILFPAYAPQYEGPSCSITKPTSKKIFIYDILPPIEYKTTKARTYTSSASVYGGGGTVTTSRTLPDDTSDGGTIGRIADSVGSCTYNAVAAFGAGQDIVLDTKGNPALGWASDNKTPATSQNLRTDYLNQVEGGYVVGPRAEVSAVAQTISVVNPIWIGKAGTTTPTQLTVDQSYAAQNGGIEYTLSASTGASSGDPSPANSWYIDVPTGKSLKVILRALDGTYPESNKQAILKKESNIDSTVWASGSLENKTIRIDRYVYNGPSYSGGLHKIIVS